MNVTKPERHPFPDPVKRFPRRFLGARRDRFSLPPAGRDIYTQECRPSSLVASIVDRITDREMVHHLPLRRGKVEVLVHRIIIERTDPGSCKPKGLRPNIQPLSNCPRFEVHIAVT